MLASRYCVISVVSLTFACFAEIAAAQTVPTEPAPSGAATTPAPAAQPAAAPEPATTPAPAPEPAVVTPQPEPMPPSTTVTTSTATSTTTTVTTPEPDLSVEPPYDAGPFAKGKIAISVLIGSSFAGDQSYLMLGAGFGYFVVNGLELGLDATFWLFDEPFAATLSPQVRYVFHMVPKLKPYVGTFFRHYMIGSGIDDFNSLGGVVGAYFVPNPRLYFGLGAVYEHLLDCDNPVFSCDDVYPELSIMIGL